MKKLYLLLIIIIVIGIFTACSESTVQHVGNEVNDSLSNLRDSDNKYVKMVKNGYRENNTEMTYDKAFSDFFGTPRWTYFESESGEDIVEFTGDCVYRDVSVKARLQFIVDENNGTFEASYLAFNEVPQDLFTMAALLEKAFEDDAGAALSVSLTEDESDEYLELWLIEREIYNDVSIEDKWEEEFGGEKYYCYHLWKYAGDLGNSGTFADIYINKNTCQAYVYDGNSEQILLLPLDDWYYNKYGNTNVKAEYLLGTWEFVRYEPVIGWFLLDENPNRGGTGVPAKEQIVTSLSIFDIVRFLSNFSCEGVMGYNYMNFRNCVVDDAATERYADKWAYPPPRPLYVLSEPPEIAVYNDIISPHSWSFLEYEQLLEVHYGFNDVKRYEVRFIDHERMQLTELGSSYSVLYYKTN